jgi:hypothetical protein
MNDGLTVELVLFHWDGQAFGIQARQVRALEPARETGAPSIGDLLGLPPASAVEPQGPQRLLWVVGPHGVQPIRVQEPVSQVSLPVANIHPLPPLLTARLRLPWVRALAYRPDGAAGTLIVILDPARTGDRNSTPLRTLNPEPRTPNPEP